MLVLSRDFTYYLQILYFQLGSLTAKNKIFIFILTNIFSRFQNLGSISTEVAKALYRLASDDEPPESVKANSTLVSRVDNIFIVARLFECCFWTRLHKCCFVICTNLTASSSSRTLTILLSMRSNVIFQTGSLTGVFKFINYLVSNFHVFFICFWCTSTAYVLY